MPFPEYEDFADALLCFIYFHGEDRAVWSNATYEPLAECFDLTQQEREQPRTDAPEQYLSQNKIQWARQRLINQGLVNGELAGLGN